MGLERLGTQIESFSSIKEAIIAKKTAKSLHTGDSNYLYNERNHDCFGKAIAISLNDLYIKKKSRKYYP